MHTAPLKISTRLLIAASLGLALAGCGGMATNNTLYSNKQPVVERQTFTLDVNTETSGLPISEQARLNGWFEAMDLGYGDRISVDDPSANPAVREAVNDLAGRYGLILSSTAPTTAGFVQPGEARIVITRSSAEVPGCPDWSKKSDLNLKNATSPNYGCAVNSNMAAMVANPEDLLEGQKASADRPVDPARNAIGAYRTGGNAGAGAPGGN
jgi:pilus assembly protein CpaD